MKRPLLVAALLLVSAVANAQTVIGDFRVIPSPLPSHPLSIPGATVRVIEKGTIERTTAVFQKGLPGNDTGLDLGQSASIDFAKPVGNLVIELTRFAAGAVSTIELFRADGTKLASRQILSASGVPTVITFAETGVSRVTFTGPELSLSLIVAFLDRR